jgi:hypothetical protein
VDEPFAGLPINTRELVVVTEGGWLYRGHSYLIDASRGKDNRYYPVMCGTTADITEKFIADVLDYLRLRAKGNAKTLLTVSVQDGRQPISGADVTITGPDGDRKALTVVNGIATFEDVRPGKYHVTAARDHYHLDADSGSDKDVSIVAGSCPFSSIAMEAEASVSGFVQDAKGAPVASLDLELITVPDNPADKISLNKPFFSTKTSEDGRFRFESVSPGRYLLGSNVIGLNSSSVPRTFYPGQSERNGAVPIDVELGAEVDGLTFLLPDFGKVRDIQVCVVDENGKSVTGASIGTGFGKEVAASARLGEKLITDETGCVKAAGYTRVAYQIRASSRPPGSDFRQIRSSEVAVIPPGEEPVLKVLTLGGPLGNSKPK